MSSRWIRRLLLTVATIFTTSARCTSIHEAFDIVRGTEPGSCNPYMQHLNTWFQDSLTLIEIAAERCHAHDDDSRQYLETFFDLKPDEREDEICGVLHRVQDFLRGRFTPMGGKPEVFCDETWMQQQEWTDVARNPYTGEPREDGAKIAQVYFQIHREHPRLSPFWSTYHHTYFWHRASDWQQCQRIQGDTFPTGVSDLSSKPHIMTICAETLAHSLRYREKLADITPITQPGVSVTRVIARAYIFLNFVFHLALDRGGFETSPIVLQDRLRPAEPDSRYKSAPYVNYALAVWLGQQNRHLTWATGVSKVKSES